MFQSEQVSILIITVFLGGLFYYLGKQINRLEKGQKPGPLVTAVIKFVSFIQGYTVDAMGLQYGHAFAPYIGSLFIYIFVANISGLFGLSSPTANFSVTLMLALLTWLSIEWMKFRNLGIKGYIKSFFEPFAFFVIPNLFSELAPLISLSLRLFGNVMAGAVVMSLLYSFTNWLSQFIPIIGQFNFIGVIVAPVLHLYFDLFSSFIQSFLFISLTVIYIGQETPAGEITKIQEN